MADIVKIIKDYIELELTTMMESNEIGLDQDLIKTGIVQSSDTFDIIGWLENRFSIKVEKGAVDDNRFWVSINTIAEYVKTHEMFDVSNIMSEEEYDSIY